MTKREETGDRWDAGLRRLLPAPCPDCGSYDLDVERDSTGQIVNVCNSCSWADR